MASRSFILLCDPTGWRFADAGGGSAFEAVDARSAPAADAATIARDRAGAFRLLLEARGYGGEPVLLLLASEQCLCASISTAGLSGRGRAQGMAYRLEEKLPIAAEDFSADFLQSAGDGALGVCVAHASLAPVLAALEKQGIAVRSISPVAVLALQQAMRRPGGDALRKCDAVVWSSDIEAVRSDSLSPLVGSASADAAAPDTQTAFAKADPTRGQREPESQRLEMFLLREGKPVAWYMLYGDAEELSLHLAVAAEGLGRPLCVAAIDLDPDASAALKGMDRSLVSDVQVSKLSMGAAAAAMVLRGRADAWIELRRGPLAGADADRRWHAPQRWAIAVALMLLISASAGMLWRSLRYDAAADAQQEQQRTVYQQAMGNANAPADVPSRLRSEERRLRLAAGGAERADRPDLPADRPLLQLLHDVLASLPPAQKARFRLEQIRLEDGHLSLQGEARGISDAQMLAAALRQVPGLHVEDPHTQQLPPQPGSAGEPTVGFTIDAQLEPAHGGGGAAVAEGGTR